MALTHPLERLYQEELYKIPCKVLVVLDKPWTALAQEEVVLLGKILNAVKLSLAGVQVVTQAEFAVEDFQSYQPSHIIAFGATLKNSSKMYERLCVAGIPMVVAHDLGALDDARKKNLWQTLKQVFAS